MIFLSKVLDTYLQWEANGQLESKLKTIKEMVEKRISQKVIAETIGVSERTLIKLRKNHAKMNEAFIQGNEVMKHQLIDAMLQRALGFEYEEVQTIIEETKTGQKKRLVKTKRKALPDISAIKYLLIVKFEREFNDHKDKIDLRSWSYATRDDFCSKIIKR